MNYTRSLFSRSAAARLSAVAVMILAFALGAVADSHPLNIPGASHTKVGIYIEDLATGEALVDVNSTRQFVPASVTKSLTTATAYCFFTPRGRFTTPVRINGTIANGVLDGDVVISTVGDPTIESVHFPENLGFATNIAAALNHLGVRSVKGTVVLDESGFTDATIPEGWLKEDIMVPYGTGVFASNFRDNRFTLSLPSKSTRPNTPGVSFNFLGGKGPLKVSREANSTVFNVTGSGRGFSATLANPAPGSAMAAEVLEAIRAEGIEIASTPRHPGVVDGELIYAHTSPEVRDVLRSLMFRSDNMMAEGMLRSFAQGRPRSEALEEERNFWLERGFDVSNLNLADGSGLSRLDRITPRFMADVYKWMYRSDLASGYANLFPRAGQDGTMRNFLKGTPLEGRLATKTGSMRGVQCYGGYMLDDSGRPSHVVVVFVNDFTCSRDKLKAEIGRLLIDTLAPRDLLDAEQE